MRKLLLMFVVVSLLSDVAMATSLNKCKVSNKTIFQDAPCAEDFYYCYKVYVLLLFCPFVRPLYFIGLIALIWFFIISCLLISGNILF